MEEKTDYITKEPAAIIEQPQPRLVLREGLGEEWSCAWVKLSTAFKAHIKELRGAPLAVWLYISLSINKNGIAFPGIKTIAEETGYSHQGVIDAIKTLEERGYLRVIRGAKRYNLYEPEFAAIGRRAEPTETVNSVESTQLSQVSGTDESTFSPEESSRVDLNKINKIKPEIPLSVENAIFLDMPVTMNETEREEREACAAFERAFGIERPWNWYPPKDEKLWADFRAKLRELWKQDPNCFEGYARWANAPYSRGAKNASQLRRDPSAFWDAWAAYKASVMYSKKTDEERPQYKTRRLETLER